MASDTKIIFEGHECTLETLSFNIWTEEEEMRKSEYHLSQLNPLGEHYKNVENKIQFHKNNIEKYKKAIEKENRKKMGNQNQDEVEARIKQAEIKAFEKGKEEGREKGREEERQNYIEEIKKLEEEIKKLKESLKTKGTTKN